MTTPNPLHGVTRPSDKLLTQYVLTALITGPLFPIVMLSLYFRYKTLKYTFDDEGIAMSWGMLWRQEVHLTYARIQDIHLSRGLIERWLGLATIQIQTASGSAGAEMSIQGLPNHEELRDYLYSRMRGARGMGSGDAEKGAQALGAGQVAGALGASGSDETAALLTEIRDELRSLRARLPNTEQASATPPVDQGGL